MRLNRLEHVCPHQAFSGQLVGGGSLQRGRRRGEGRVEGRGGEGRMREGEGEGRRGEGRGGVGEGRVGRRGKGRGGGGEGRGGEGRGRGGEGEGRRRGEGRGGEGRGGEERGGEVGEQTTETEEYTFLKWARQAGMKSVTWWPTLHTDVKMETRNICT